jgi:hypothetical protein
MRVSAGGRVLSVPGSFLSSSITGTRGPGPAGHPGNAGRVTTLGAGPMTPGQQPARVWRRVAGGS